MDPTKPMILVVDDEPANIKLLQVYLSSSGYEPLSAVDGQDALGKFSRQKVDMVVLDVMMPNMDGLSVCRQLRSDPKNNTLPILILTGMGADSDIVKALEAGADDYVMKPFVKEELMAKIETLLSKAKSGSLPGRRR